MPSKCKSILCRCCICPLSCSSLVALHKSPLCCCSSVQIYVIVRSFAGREGSYTETMVHPTKPDIALQNSSKCTGILILCTHIPQQRSSVAAVAAQAGDSPTRVAGSKDRYARQEVSLRGLSFQPGEGQAAKGNCLAGPSPAKSQARGVSWHAFACQLRRALACHWSVQFPPQIVSHSIQLSLFCFAVELRSLLFSCHRQCQRNKENFVLFVV